jgi:hypothetical protein
VGDWGLLLLRGLADADAAFGFLLWAGVAGGGGVGAARLLATPRVGSAPVAASAAVLLRVLRMMVESAPERVVF